MGFSYESGSGSSLRRITNLEQEIVLAKQNLKKLKEERNEKLQEITDLKEVRLKNPCPKAKEFNDEINEWVELDRSLANKIGQAEADRGNLTISIQNYESQIGNAERELQKLIEARRRNNKAYWERHKAA